MVCRRGSASDTTINSEWVSAWVGRCAESSWRGPDAQCRTSRVHGEVGESVCCSGDGSLRTSGQPDQAAGIEGHRAGVGQQLAGAAQHMDEDVEIRPGVGRDVAVRLELDDVRIQMVQHRR